MNLLDVYVKNEPNNQNILDIFKGEWSSKLPSNLELKTEPGAADLFEDARVTWTENIFGDFKDWKILELGPLEGGHSYMFQNKGASKVISIEANTRAFLKCLCIKEILKMDKVEFRLGDFMSFLRTDNSMYDMVFASGVLYHMVEPVELIKLISKVSNKTFIWTQYFDEEIINSNPNLKSRFSKLKSIDYDGVIYEYAEQAYLEALEWSGFCGGPKPVSRWLTKASILRALKYYGFNDIQINFDHPGHQNGPAFALCAQK